MKLYCTLLQYYCNLSQNNTHLVTNVFSTYWKNNCQLVILDCNKTLERLICKIVCCGDILRRRRRQTVSGFLYKAVWSWQQSDSMERETGVACIGIRAGRDWMSQHRSSDILSLTSCFHCITISSSFFWLPAWWQADVAGGVSGYGYQNESWSDTLNRRN